MAVKQVSIFVENTTGRLAQLTQILADNDIDIRAAVIAETSDFGILRLIVKEPEKAKEILNKNHFNATLSDIVCVSISDKAGSFNDILHMLANENIPVKYIYSTVTSAQGEAIIMMKFPDAVQAEKILKANGIKMYQLEEL